MTLIPCDAFCGAMVDARTSKKIWVTRDGYDYQADLCNPCFVRVEAELKAVGVGLTPHIQGERDFADPFGGSEVRE